MSSPEDLLTACATSQEERQRLTSRANDALLLWDNWLHPFTSGSETGDDPAYDDNFLLMREEINKISGTDSARLKVSPTIKVCANAFFQKNQPNLPFG